MSKFLEKNSTHTKKPQGVNLVAIGADNRIRTYDLLITNEPLYQLDDWLHQILHRTQSDLFHFLQTNY